MEVEEIKEMLKDEMNVLNERIKKVDKDNFIDKDVYTYCYNTIYDILWKIQDKENQEQRKENEAKLMKVIISVVSPQDKTAYTGTVENFIKASNSDTDIIEQLIPLLDQDRVELINFHEGNWTVTKIR